jgi:hypothetical protein
LTEEAGFDFFAETCLFGVLVIDFLTETFGVLDLLLDLDASFAAGLPIFYLINL